MPLSRKQKSSDGARRLFIYTVSFPSHAVYLHQLITPKNPVCIFVAFLCACANGYDGLFSTFLPTPTRSANRLSTGSLMGSVLAMDHYQNVFKTGLKGEKVSIVTSLYTVYVHPLHPSAMVSNSLPPEDRLWQLPSVP